MTTTDLPRKALSLRQPWAYAVIHMAKDIENRKWLTRHRGPVLIHAAKGMTRDEYDDFRQFAQGKFWQPALPDVPPYDDLDRGGIVGMAVIVGCVTGHPSKWFVGPYGFVLANPAPLPFTPCRGSLGLFDVPDEVLATLRQAIAVAPEAPPQ